MNTSDVVSDLREATACLLAIGDHVESLSGNMFEELVVDIAADVNLSIDVLVSVIEIVQGQLRTQRGQPHSAPAVAPLSSADRGPASRHSAGHGPPIADDAVAEAMDRATRVAGWPASPAQLRHYLCRSSGQDRDVRKPPADAAAHWQSG